MLRCPHNLKSKSAKSQSTDAHYKESSETFREACLTLSRVALVSPCHVAQNFEASANERTYHVGIAPKHVLEQLGHGSHATLPTLHQNFSREKTPFGEPASSSPRRM